MDKSSQIQASDSLNLRVCIQFTSILAISNGIQRFKINTVRALCENEDVNFMRLRQTWQMFQTDGIFRNIPKE